MQMCQVATASPPPKLIERNPAVFLPCCHSDVRRCGLVNCPIRSSVGSAGRAHAVQLSTSYLCRSGIFTGRGSPGKDVGHTENGEMIHSIINYWSYKWGCCGNPTFCCQYPREEIGKEFELYSGGLLDSHVW
ncbi:uncharacterized protein LOC118005904 isoform X2 [Mirounga leonina]|uniref:uncharacterized protein LOC118005904 isoform X2 n=1 Tax=Mirounga leonina TaxID=9715 RepID=UPI00156C0CC2|nr:uncharacterized protein LOC118005904 isoform X2 [Mirounga leonina]